MKLSAHSLVSVIIGWMTALFATMAMAAAPAVPRIEGVEILPDQGWSGNPDVIWYDNFDSPEPLLSRYLEASDQLTTVTSEALGGSGKSVRARFGPGSVESGGIKKTFGRNPMDYRSLGSRKNEDFTEIYWRHYIKHQEGWTGNPNKLSRAIAFSAADWSEAMIAHIWNGNSNNIAIDPVRGVNADSQVVTSGYNDFDSFTWLGHQDATTQIFNTAESGRWVSVEGHVKLNTPGKSDGVFELYIDGQVEVSRRTLNWVYSWNDYGINAVFLENYWGIGSLVKQERFFDDFVISTSYIGLANSPLNPQVTKTSFRDTDVADSQSAWRLQIASNLDGSDMIWDSAQIEGSGESIIVDATNGTFLGTLEGHSQLSPGHLYALRVQQRDLIGNWSAWSSWSSSLKTVATVPEPTSISIVLMGMAFVTAIRRPCGPKPFLE